MRWTRKRPAAAIVAAVVLLLVLDLRRAPAEQWSADAAVSAIHAYQATVSQWYAQIGVRCRFTPSCSHYGEECIRRFGAARGSWLAMKRVLRCGPWTPLGTNDPPPST
jgi:putative membrane protein insertion efficiency factor